MSDLAAFLGFSWSIVSVFMGPLCAVMSLVLCLFGLRGEGFRRLAIIGVILSVGVIAVTLVTVGPVLDAVPDIIAGMNASTYNEP